MANKEDYFIYIIIPAYNRELFIARTLDSVISQSYEKWEIVVVDDGSTDGTNLIVSEYAEKNKGKIIYRYKRNSGSGSARNLGIETVLTENSNDNALILFLDSDDELLPGALELAVEKVQSSKDIKSFGFSYKNNFEEKTTFLLKNEMILNFENIINKKNVRNDTLNLFFTTIFEDNLFRFDEKLNGGECLLFWNIYKKYDTLFSGDILGIYHQDADNSLQRAKLTQKKIINMRDLNKKIINSFKTELIAYNTSLLGEVYLALARAEALLGNRVGSALLLIKGLRYKPLDIKRIVLYLISLIDINLALNNLLVKYFLNRHSILSKNR